MSEENLMDDYTWQDLKWDLGLLTTVIGLGAGLGVSMAILGLTKAVVLPFRIVRTVAK